MFKLIKNVCIYSPIYLGKKDILICNDKIIKIEENIDYNDALIIDKSGMIAIPGIIDQHVHVIGGGGEGGFHTRTPEVKLSELVANGITTVVGLLGTDNITRSVEDLVGKIKALKNEGISAYCLTGAYTYPSPTITGSISKDIVFIDEIIGCKLALSDHRSSQVTDDELIRLVSVVRVAGLISGKAGIVALHVGNDTLMLNQVMKVIENTSLPISHFRPTHVNRNKQLFENTLTFLRRGGTVDLTVGNDYEILKENIKLLKTNNLALDRVTFSSDGNGSWSRYDQNGKLIKMGVSGCDGIYQSIKYLIKNGFGIEETIQFGTTNVAKALNIDNKKGYLKVGYDADLILLNKDFQIDTVFALGKMMVSNHEVLIKGTYE
jgi:beta-aspartyl-dipeptidase (metallo-type)